MSDGPVQGGSDHGAARASGPGAPGEIRPGPLERQLGGDLPCVVCRYNLRGLSIRSVCPECGTAVRATILALVDPHASELEPIASPRVTALGLVAWIGGALAAMALAWLPAHEGWYALWHVAVLGGVIVSGVGALALVRPHAGTPRAGAAMASIAVAAYAPLSWLVWQATSWEHTAGRSAVVPFVAQPMPDVPTAARVMACVLVAGVAILLRPNARLLVARSLALRTGRVDRQTILAIVAAAGIAALGETLVGITRGAQGRSADTAGLAGEILLVAGWALVTLGLLGSLIDAVRIARSIVMPPPSLGEVIEKGSLGGAGASARRVP
jgi:hypothetical protein